MLDERKKTCHFHSDMGACKQTGSCSKIKRRPKRLDVPKHPPRTTTQSTCSVFTMCLKYFVGHTTCEHYEYLGSHHCSLRPCSLDAQHFHYIYDDFPIPRSPDSVTIGPATDVCILACNSCAAEHPNKLDPDEAPVQYYPPTNNYNVEEVRPTGHVLPINVVRVQTENVKETRTKLDYNNDNNNDYDYDYKSLSDSEDDDWDETGVQSNHVFDADLPHRFIEEQLERMLVREQMAEQLSNLQNYVVQQSQPLPFVLPGLTPAAYAMGHYMHYLMPHRSYLAPPSMLTMPFWHGFAPALSSMESRSVVPHPSSPWSPPTLGNTVVSNTPATPQVQPVTPPPTPPNHPLPRCPTPPYIVGSITDAYLRMEAAKHRHRRSRGRRLQSSLREALPTRSASLANFMVQKRAQRSRRQIDADVNVDVEVDVCSGLPFAIEESDTGAGAEECAESLVRGDG